MWGTCEVVVRHVGDMWGGCSACGGHVGQLFGMWGTCGVVVRHVGDLWGGFSACGGPLGRWFGMWGTSGVVSEVDMFYFISKFLSILDLGPAAYGLAINNSTSDAHLQKLLHFVNKMAAFAEAIVAKR